MQRPVNEPQKRRRISKTSKNAEESTVFLNNLQKNFNRDKFLSDPKNESTKFTTFVQKIFQGCIVSNIRCLSCDNQRSRTEPFFDLSLTIEKDKGLMWSFSQFVASERLQGQNKYKCDNCNAMSDAVRDIRFSFLPSILTIHLKRFSYDKIRQKVTCHVDCPLDLNLDTFSTDQCKSAGTNYELFALILHKGNFSSCGHYVTVIKVNSQTGQFSNGSNKDALWLYLDDDHTSFLSLEKVQSLISSQSSSLNTAYILFYQQREQLMLLSWMPCSI